MKKIMGALLMTASFVTATGAAAADQADEFRLIDGNVLQHRDRKTGSLSNCEVEQRGNTYVFAGAFQHRLNVAGKKPQSAITKELAREQGTIEITVKSAQGGFYEKRVMPEAVAKNSQQDMKEILASEKLCKLQVAQASGLGGPAKFGKVVPKARTTWQVRKPAKPRFVSVVMK